MTVLGFDSPLEKTPVRFSRLKYMAQSPAHYHHAMLEPSQQTEAMRRGSYTHALVLGTSDRWVQYDGVRRGKFWDAFQEDHHDKEIITPGEAAPCERMAAAVRRNAEAMALIGGGVCERTIGWDFLGRACEGTPDVVGAEYVADLKTTKCSEPGRFARDATFRHYHAQLAWYLDGANSNVIDVTKRDAYVIAVESTPPYPVTVLKLTDAAIEAGRKLCRLWMERLLTCEASNEWPGYVQSVVDFDVAGDVDLDFGDDNA
jgi:hypothetical protein